jgi:hypothetical protein
MPSSRAVEFTNFFGPVTPLFTSALDRGRRWPARIGIGMNRMDWTRSQQLGPVEFVKRNLAGVVPADHHPGARGATQSNGTATGAVKASSW